jgi:hypothetical protein
MITSDETLYFFNIRDQQKFWKEIYPSAPPASKFYIDITKRINPHRLCNRNEGEWSLPWKQHAPDKFKMLPYDPNFNKTYEGIENVSTNQSISYFAYKYTGAKNLYPNLAITIENPTEGASISGEVHVHIHVTDESLHEMDVKVTKDSDGSELFTASPAVHDETDYHFEAYFTPSVAAETAVTMTVTVIDHGDNSSTKTVKFTVKP